MKKILENALAEGEKYKKQGKAASYIPELAKADTSDFGITVVSSDGVISVGDSDKLFTIQSVVKPIILLAALLDSGREAVSSLVGVEATGKPFDAFNYSDQAMQKEHINPMINAGAIALCPLIKGENADEKFERLISLARKISGNNRLSLNENVYLSERATGNKNRALAYMLKAYGMLDCDVEPVLEVYFKACSINVSATDLAKIAYVLALRGKDPVGGEELIPSEFARYINAVLSTSGMYDGSGEFALNVGIPAKSGVGGGIMAVVPGRMGIGLYSPALDKKGNSIAGIKALEYLSRELDLSIF